MTLDRLDCYMPLASSLAMGPLLWVMWQKKLHVELPNFFRYAVFFAISALTMFFLAWSPHYTYAFWFLSFVYSVASFFVLYEVFVRLLKPYSAVIDLATMIFKWAGGFLAAVGVMTALATAGNVQNKFDAAVNLIDQSLMLMECGMLMLLLVFEKRLGISWRSRPAVISIGMGAAASSGLLHSYLAVRLPALVIQFDLAYGLVVIGSIVYWTVMLYLPEPQRTNVLASPSRLIFQRWNEVLSSTPLVAQGRQFAVAEVDSFIPGVEKTVERIMARKMSGN
ncbi:MAG TPA: hypothetical protein VNW97_06650 [Candidatus Saccharimonadales bacterium]|jgi:hypothetical protein|nr:hypothetical protein [Candidatus Saccharimonadales bacterium]